MTTLEDEIRARLEAATPGPWTGTTRDSVGGGMIYGADGWAVAEGSYADRRLEPEFDANVALIASAPADLAYLLEQVRALDFLAREISAARDSLAVQRDEAQDALAMATSDMHAANAEAARHDDDRAEALRERDEALFEVRRLRTLINEARLAVKVPGAHDCRLCGGEGTEYDDEVGAYPCSCISPEGLAAFRAAWEANARDEEARHKLANDEAIRREHGHEPDAPCVAACPLWF